MRGKDYDAEDMADAILARERLQKAYDNLRQLNSEERQKELQDALDFYDSCVPIEVKREIVGRTNNSLEFEARNFLWTSLPKYARLK